MKRTQIFALLGALIISSATLAEGGGDRTFEKMMAARDVAMEAYVAREGNSVPVVSSDTKDETNKM
jgi:hypothetical protein